MSMAFQHFNKEKTLSQLTLHKVITHSTKLSTKIETIIVHLESVTPIGEVIQIT